FQPQKNLQLSLIPLNFVRPVTPKVAGSSPVAPASWMTMAFGYSRRAPTLRERRHRGLAQLIGDTPESDQPRPKTNFRRNPGIGGLPGKGLGALAGSLSPSSCLSTYAACAV